MIYKSWVLVLLERSAVCCGGQVVAVFFVAPSSSRSRKAPFFKGFHQGVHVKPFTNALRKMLDPRAAFAGDLGEGPFLLVVRSWGGHDTKAVEIGRVGSGLADHVVAGTETTLRIL